MRFVPDNQILHPDRRLLQRRGRLSGKYGRSVPENGWWWGDGDRCLPDIVLQKEEVYKILYFLVLFRCQTLHPALK
jgi:hypothetical protein